MITSHFLYLLVTLLALNWSLAFKKTSTRNRNVDSLVSSDVKLRNLDGSNWMRDNMQLLGPRTLKQVCIPGSHDAGMSEFQSGTTLAHPCNVLTQSLPIGGQLNNGVRYFDVRPVIGGGGRFLTGHYSFLAKESWQGGNGQSIESIVNDLNQFTRSHNEVIIIRLAHSLNTEIGNRKYRKFNQLEWERLFHILDRTNNLFVTNNKNTQLPSLTLNQLTQNGKKAAVIYVLSEENSEANLSNRLGKGFFDQTNINMYHKYSKTNKLSHMVQDQLKKLKEFSRNTYFLLSWTLTQGVKEVALCSMKLGKSIRNLAEIANDKLANYVYSEVSTTYYPNVIYADNIKNMDVVTVAMAINKKLNF